MLTIVPTPIGNLKDITLRALETLKSSDSVVCEDSRRASLLLNHYQINKPLLVLNDFNEPKIAGQIIEKLKKGENIALISDAGTPLISDPGFKLINLCLKSGIVVDSLPGPSSPITALTLSTLPPDKFLFLGYLPDKTGHRQKIYQKVTEISKIISVTFIILVAPFKLERTLSEINDNLGDIEVVLAKELTKIYQNVEKKTTENWLQDFKSKKPKGEYVLLFNLTGSFSNQPLL